MTGSEGAGRANNPPGDTMSQNRSSAVMQQRSERLERAEDYA